MSDYKITDINGHEMKAGEFFKFVPVLRKVKPEEYQKPEIHKEGECEGSSNHWCGQEFIFSYAFGPQKETPFGPPVSGNFGAFKVIEDGVRGGHSITIQREAMRKDHYVTHDLQWIEGRTEKLPKARRAKIAKAEAIYAKAPKLVREKYKAWAPSDFKEDGNLDGDAVYRTDELEWTLKAMEHDFYLEDRDAQEGELCDVRGLDDEEKSVELWLEPTKYGSWHLHKWDAGKGQWFTADKKRKGTSIEICWTPYEGD